MVEISPDTKIIVLMFFASALWLLFTFALEPRARTRLRVANVLHLPQIAAYLAGLRVLRVVFSTAIVATVFVSLGALLLQWYLDDVPATADGVAMVVSARNAWEGTLGLARYASMWIWIGAVVVLALIWWLVVRAKSRRRWSEAIDSRRRAIAAAIADLSGGPLRVRACEADAPAVEDLEKRVTSVREAGMRLIEKAMAAPLVSIGDQTASLDQLRELEADLRRRDSTLEVVDDAIPSAETVYGR